MVITNYGNDYNKKSPDNAMRNAQQWCTIVHQWLVDFIRRSHLYGFWLVSKKAQQNKISHQRQPDNRLLNIYSVLLVLTRGCHLSCSANAVLAENCKFFPPLSFSTLVQGDLLQIYGQALLILKLRVFRAANGVNLEILVCTVLDWSTRVMDRQMDG